MYIYKILIPDERLGILWLTKLEIRLLPHLLAYGIYVTMDSSNSSTQYFGRYYTDKESHLYEDCLEARGFLFIWDIKGGRVRTKAQMMQRYSGFPISDDPSYMVQLNSPPYRRYITDIPNVFKRAYYRGSKNSEYQYDGNRKMVGPVEYPQSLYSSELYMPIENSIPYYSRSKKVKGLTLHREKHVHKSANIYYGTNLKEVKERMLNVNTILSNAYEDYAREERLYNYCFASGYHTSYNSNGLENNRDIGPNPHSNIVKPKECYRKDSEGEVYGTYI